MQHILICSIKCPYHPHIVSYILSACLTRVLHHSLLITRLALLITITHQQHILQLQPRPLKTEDKTGFFWDLIQENFWATFLFACVLYCPKVANKPNTFNSPNYCPRHVRPSCQSEDPKIVDPTLAMGNIMKFLLTGICVNIPLKNSDI